MQPVSSLLPASVTKFRSDSFSGSKGEVRGPAVAALYRTVTGGGSRSPAGAWQPDAVSRASPHSDRVDERDLRKNGVMTVFSSLAANSRLFERAESRVKAAQQGGGRRRLGFRSFAGHARGE